MASQFTERITKVL